MQTTNCRFEETGVSVILTLVELDRYPLSGFYYPAREILLYQDKSVGYKNEKINFKRLVTGN